MSLWYFTISEDFMSDRPRSRMHVRFVSEVDAELLASRPHVTNELDLERLHVELLLDVLVRRLRALASVRSSQGLTARPCIHVCLCQLTYAQCNTPTCGTA